MRDMGERPHKARRGEAEVGLDRAPGMMNACLCLVATIGKVTVRHLTHTFAVDGRERTDKSGKNRIFPTIRVLSVGLMD
jgi:hypothetical protein